MRFMNMGPRSIFQPNFYTSMAQRKPMRLFHSLPPAQLPFFLTFGIKEFLSVRR